LSSQKKEQNHSQHDHKHVESLKYAQGVLDWSCFLCNLFI